MRGTKYCRQGKNVIITFILHNIPDNFHADHHPLLVPYGVLWGSPNMEGRGDKVGLVEHDILSHNFENSPSYGVPHVCNQNFYLWKIRKLPQECSVSLSLVYMPLLCRNSWFSIFKYPDFGYTTHLTRIWDPRNFHHPALSRCHFLLPTQDVGGRWTSI